jgi:hypothetical protein
VVPINLCERRGFQLLSELSALAQPRGAAGHSGGGGGSNSSNASAVSGGAAGAGTQMLPPAPSASNVVEFYGAFYKDR